MTVSRPDAALPIDVHGQLRLDGPSGRPVTLTAAGSQLCLALPGWSNLDDFGTGSLRAQRRAVARTIGALKAMRLTLDVDIDGRRVFGIGDGVRTTLLARLLGLTSADFRAIDIYRLFRARAAARRTGRR